MNIQKLLIITVAVMGLHLSAAYAGETDNRIESAAKNSYVFKHYLKDDSIDVKSKDGVVTLSGNVSDPNHKSLAEDTVAGLPGVINVQNTIEVKGESPVAENSDPWLALKVKTALLFHRGINGFATHVEVKEGVVTLTGEARDQAQKDLTADYVKDIDGIKSVNNNMTIASPSDHDNAMRAPKDGMADARDQSADKANDANETIDDASITAQAKMTLLFNRSTSALSTKVTTENGVVTLTGNAKSDAEKSLAGKLVGDIRGVKNVINNMTVVGQ